MTNEEQAKKIAEKIIGDAATSFLGWINETSVTFCEQSAQEMAEWKDRQYAEIIKDECNNSYESGLCEGRRMTEKQFKEYLEKKKENMIGKWGHLVVAAVSTIDMIINELFPND